MQYEILVNTVDNNALKIMGSPCHLIIINV